MKDFVGLAILLASAARTAYAGCDYEAGNYYCNQVKQIVYNNIGFSGSYNAVTSFNSDGQCSSTPHSFSGTLAPLNEGLSFHIRGPVSLKQFGVYTLGAAPAQKRDIELAIEQAGPHHVHFDPHKRVLVTEIIHVTKTVIEVDGVETTLGVVPEPSSSSILELQPSSSSSSSSRTPSPPAPFSSQGAAVAEPAGFAANEQSSASSTSQVATTSTSTVATISTSAAAPSGSGWQQTAYYNSEQGVANGLVFMNNEGGSGSGVWDILFGNSISYAGSDGLSCASSPQTLSDTTLPSDKELIIFSNSPCSGDNCGFYRPGIPAYHGFSGANKVFVMEFGMPTDTTSSPSTYNFDMPALWLLNAQIPRTLQYGVASCSCWPGCGEFDIFEVLNSGNTKLTNHLHDAQGTNVASTGGGGSADYFARPTSGTMKAAVVFDASTSSITITQLDPNTSFPSFLSTDTVNDWLSANAGSQSYASI